MITSDRCVRSIRGCRGFCFGASDGVLQAFLSRPHIYSTDHFRGRYEVSARANLARSIERLGANK